MLKIEDDERERELDPGRAEDVPCPGEAQDAVFSKCVGSILECCPFQVAK